VNDLTVLSFTLSLIAKFHDQGDAKCIVIRGQLRGHNGPIGRPVVCRPQGVFGGFL
jgi:hypothetical protein